MFTNLYFICFVVTLLWLIYDTMKYFFHPEISDESIFILALVLFLPVFIVTLKFMDFMYGLLDKIIRVCF